VLKILATQFGQNHRPFIKGVVTHREENWYKVAPLGCIITYCEHDKAPSMLRHNNYHLVAVDLGEQIYMQNGLGKAAPSYLASIASVAAQHKTGVIALADFYSMQESEIWKALGSKTMYFIEKPVDVPKLMKTLENCLKIATLDVEPIIRVTNPTADFYDRLRTSARKEKKRSSIAFPENQKVFIPDEIVPYSVCAGSDLLFTTKTKEWYDFAPMIKPDLGKLNQKLMEWYLASERVRTDGKTTNYELLLK